MVSRRRLVSPRLVVSFPSGKSDCWPPRPLSRLNGWTLAFLSMPLDDDDADLPVDSDGIARVHGMHNVQAEELVE